MIRTLDDIMYITDGQDPFKKHLIYGNGGLGYKPTSYNMVGGGWNIDTGEEPKVLGFEEEGDINLITMTEDELIDRLNENLQILDGIIHKKILHNFDLNEESKFIDDVNDENNTIYKILEEHRNQNRRRDEDENQRKADEFREKKDKEKEEMNKRLIFDVLKIPYDEMKEKEEMANKFREKQLINKVGKPFIESMKTDQLEKLEYFEPEKTPEEMFNTLKEAKINNNINLPNGLALEELTKKTNEWGQPLKDGLNDNSTIKGFEDEVKNIIPIEYHQEKYKVKDKFPWEWVHMDLTQDKNLTDSKAYIFLRDGSSLGVNFEETNDKFNKYCYELRKKLIDEEKNNDTSNVRKNEIKNILSSQQNFENEIIKRNEYPYILITRGKITGLNEGGNSNMTENIYGNVNGKPKVIGVKFNYYPIFDPTVGKPIFKPVNKNIQSKINKDLNYDMLTNRGRYIYKVLDDNNFVLSNGKGRLKYNTFVDKGVTYYKVFPNKFFQIETTK